MTAHNGYSDSEFIARVRRLIRDEPVWQSESQPTDGTTGVLAAGSKPFRLQRAPVYAQPSGAAQVNIISAPGGPYQIVYDAAPAAGQVEVVTETGEVIFNSAPALGNLQAIYQSVRFTDNQVLNALLEGLSLLWPEIYDANFQTALIALSPTSFEYTLPTVFQDPRVVIQEVEYAPPGGILKYQRTGSWRQVQDGGTPLLVFDRFFPPGSQCRISYAAPFESLSQTPTQAMFLPVYYAISRLLLDQETMRLRSDDIQALTGEGAAQAGLNTSTADYWHGRFEGALQKLALDVPSRRTVAGRAAERLGLSRFWQLA